MESSRGLERRMRMGIIDRIFSRNAINELPPQDTTLAMGLSLFNQTAYDTGSVLFAIVVKKIMNGLKNIQYISENKDKRNEKIITFVTANLQLIIWEVWNRGIVAISKDSAGELFIVDYNDFLFGPNGEVTNYECVYYSDVYRFFRISDTTNIKRLLKKIDKLEDTDMNLSENYGAIGLLTGKGLPVNPKDKEEFEEKLRKDYGGGSDKRNILVSTLPLDFGVMTFPVAGLQLKEKSEAAFKQLCNYFDIPLDLVIGNSTYENQAQAIKNFYQNCIAPLAEIGLELARHLVKMDVRNFTPSSALSFRIDNVAELKDDYHIVDNDYVSSLLQNIKTSKEMMIDTTELENELKSYYKNMR